jgi:hypothetical protein
MLLPVVDDMIIDKYPNEILNQVGLLAMIDLKL